MPPKFDDESIALFKSIGLTQAKAAEAAKSPKSAVILKQLIEEHELAVDEKKAGLIAALAVQLSKTGTPIEQEGRDFLVGKITGGDIKSTDQVTAATKFVEVHPPPVDETDFNKECGVGFSITAEELLAKVADYIASNAIAGWANLGAVISGVKGNPDLRWASPLDLKNSVEKAFTDKFGPKEAAKPKGKEPKKENPGPRAEASTSAAPPRKSVFEEGFLGALHKPGGNPQIHPHLREQHLAYTKGLVHTRFPPEPNGYLHIGHSKAIFVNFGYAAHHGGRCILRYDDTNPEKEEARYFESILEMVRWLGYEPWKITYSSDYFEELYALAVELIKRDKAYVCHCTKEEIKIGRGLIDGEKGGPRSACSHRSRPIEESLAEFEGMKNGKFRPTEANLRMKQDFEDGNPQMWDLTAYRVLDSPHHRTGDKWKIYPTYDFTHCLVDSFENISHSLCTTEFVASRHSYEWLVDALEIYKPRQNEYGRLNVQGTVMSKRKILALVEEKFVRDWDDPRLYTLIALRRRGVPPGAIISFVSTLGVSTSPSNIEVSRFDQTVRQYLEGSAPRLLMVMRPLKVTIENLAEDYCLMIDKALHPKSDMGSTSIPFTRTIYIDAEDFRLEDSKDYFRLAPGKTVGLFQAPSPITCTSHKTDPVSGEVVELICRLENEGPLKKPKAYIQWVAEHAPSGSPVYIDETRIFHQLFKSDNPAASADYKADLAEDSVEVVKGAMVEVGFWSLAKRSIVDARKEGQARTEKALKDAPKREETEGARDETPHATSEQLVGKECVRFQGLRVAYFALDKDARLTCLDEEEGVAPGRKQGDLVILNRIVSLKEDSGKTS